MLNKVVLIGRLTKDPENKVFDNGNEVCTFTLAVDRNFKGQDGERATDFIPIVAWGKTAELCRKYLEKGRQTAVSGRIQARSYKAKDGTMRYVTEVIAGEVTFLGGRKDSTENKDTKNNNFIADEYMDGWSPF